MFLGHRQQKTLQQPQTREKEASLSAMSLAAGGRELSESILDGVQQKTKIIAYLPPYSQMNADLCGGG